MSFVRNGLATALLSSMALTDSSVNASMGWGWCPLPWDNPKTVGSNGIGFEPARYAGKWYEIRRDKDVWYQQESKCVTATYTYFPDRWWWPWPVNVNNRSVKKQGDPVKDPTWLGLTYSWARCDYEGACNVKFWWYPEGQYLVLDTDYDSYSLVYGCDNWFGLFYTN